MKPMDLFKDFPEEWTKYGLMGCIETLKITMWIAKNVETKEEFISMTSGLLKSVEKDLEEIRNK